MALVFQLSPVCSAVIRAPAPLGHRRKPARLIVHSSPAAPCAQERAPQASRLLPQPTLRHPLWMGRVAGGPRFHMARPAALPPATSSGWVCFLQISCSSARVPPRSPLPFTVSAEVGLCPRAEAGGHHGTGGPAHPPGHPGRLWWRLRCRTYCLPAGLEFSVWSWGSRKHICNAICWPGARADPWGMK